MMKMTRQLGAAAVLLTVLAIFIMPAVNLQPTAMRAYRAAQELIMGFAFLAMLVVSIPSLTVVHLAAECAEIDNSRIPHLRVIDLTCTRLC